MNKLLTAAVMTALMTAAVPGWAQTASPQTATEVRSDQSIAPGTGGVSKPDEPSIPGNKSDAAVKPSEMGR